MKVRQNLSSEALFHFVTNREYLVDILKNGFQPRYSLELLPIPEKNIPIGILMKCFCDIPLGMIKKHLSSYGKYGIGISKDFSKKNGISPVLYVHDGSKTLRGYLSDIRKSKQGTSTGSLLPYLKQYEEFVGRKKIRYYDEREWRYIPNTKETFVWSEDAISKDEFVRHINERILGTVYLIIEIGS